jgi:membrane protein required for colicin V production
MTIDILFLLLVALGFYKGFTKGIVMAALSLVGYVAAIFATMFFTQKIIAFVNWKSAWAPIVCYVALFIGVIILFRLLGKLIESMLEAVELNFANKLTGGIVGMMIATAVFSSIIWMLMNVNVLPASSTTDSKAVKYLIPIGHFVIETSGKLFPIVKQFFIHLKADLFDAIKKV